MIAFGLVQSLRPTFPKCQDFVMKLGCLMKSKNSDHDMLFMMVVFSVPFPYIIFKTSLLA